MMLYLDRLEQPELITYLDRHVYCAVTELCVWKINNAPLPRPAGLPLVTTLGY